MKDWIIKVFKKLKRLITYGIVGVINTGVDYGVFTLEYSVLGIQAGVSQAVSFLCGTVCGYLLNSNFTFSEGKGRTKAQFLQYLGVDIVFTILSSLTMKWLEGRGWNAYLVKIVITVVVMLLHYVIFKHLVFRIRKEDSK